MCHELLKNSKNTLHASCMVAQKYKRDNTDAEQITKCEHHLIIINFKVTAHLKRIKQRE